MFEERVVLGGGVLFELAFRSRSDYRLACLKDKQLLVEYTSGGRTLRGRTSAYEFKSVEKLRYDFERDARDAERQG
jgi:hypothetical protein